jgi:hypothetical protein
MKIGINNQIAYNLISVMASPEANERVGEAQRNVCK